MLVPDKTSPAELEHYAMGQNSLVSKGPAWQDVRLSVIVMPATSGIFKMPAISEPLIAWTACGEAEARERENDGPWTTTHLKRGSMFLTTGGAPYDFQFRKLTPERFETVLVTLSLPLFNEALEDVYGTKANRARLRDLSGFEDPALSTLIQYLREEAERRTPSRCFVRGIAQAIAVHLARNYADLSGKALSTTSLPGFKLKRITDWMAEHLSEEFNLGRLAKQAGMSEFHFNRLFKRATGLPPSKYLIKLRVDAGCRLLRETKKSIIEIANELGYSNPSHFAQLFRKTTGQAPSDYRRER